MLPPGPVPRSLGSYDDAVEEFADALSSWLGELAYTIDPNRSGSS